MKYLLNPVLLTIFCVFAALLSCEKAGVPSAEEDMAGSSTKVINNDADWDSLNKVVQHELEMGTHYFYVENKYDSALLCLEKIEPFIEEFVAYKKDPDLYFFYVSMIGSKGNCQALLGNIEEGLENMKTAYDLINLNLPEDHFEKRGVCVGLSFNYSVRGDYENAIYWQQRGLALQQKHDPNNPFIGNWHWNTAFFQTQQGNYVDAVSNYQKAAAIFREKYPSLYPSACERIADTYVKLGQLDDALLWFNLGLKAAEALPDPTADRAILHIGLAGMNLALEQPEAAEKHLKIAEKGVGAPGVPPYLISEYHLQNARLSESRGNFKEAIGHLNLALANNRFRHVVLCYDGMSQSLGYVRNIDLQNWVTTLYEKIAAPDSALTVVQHIFAGAVPGFMPNNAYTNPAISTLPHSAFLITTLQNKARLLENRYKRTGNQKDRLAAMETYRLGIAFVDKLSRDLKWDNSKYTLLERAIPLYEGAIGFFYNLAEGQPDSRYSEEAWVMADRLKAVTLLEQLASLDSKRVSGLPESFHTFEKELQREISFLEHQILACQQKSDNENAQRVIGYKSRLTIAKNSHDSLIQSVQQQNNSYFQLRYDRKPMSWARLQQKVLKPGTALLEYFVGDSAVYVFLVSDKGVRAHREKMDAELADAVQWIRTIKSENSVGQHSRFVKESRLLFDRLVGPVMGMGVALDKLIIVPDGVLGYLPFHILLESAVSPSVLAAEDWRSLPYLMKTKTVRYEYAAALLLNQDRPKIRDEVYVGFAPKFGGAALTYRGIDSLVLSRNWRNGNIPDLQSNRPEVQSVGQLASGRYYLSEAATEDAFKKNAQGKRMIHLATHACTDDGNPLYSQILFSQVPGDTIEDGALHAYEIYSMRLDADLAVLSACQTGGGKVQRGEGIMSLSRAFKYAGCPNIVMSLWNADDEASKDIMVSFFKNLKSGMGKDEALSRAQRNYLSNAPQVAAHPKYWATFVLVGDDRPVYFYSEKLMVSLLALAVSGLLIYFFWVRRCS